MNMQEKKKKDKFFYLAKRSFSCVPNSSSFTLLNLQIQVQSHDKIMQYKKEIKKTLTLKHYLVIWHFDVLRGNK
jgi:hypothetical protein